MSFISTKHPVDTIIVSKQLFLGTYHHLNNTRVGEILIYDTLSAQPYIIPTSGTLALSFNQNLFAANSADISIFDQKSLLKKIETKHLNTHISCDSQLIISNSYGEINVFTPDLTPIGTYKLCDNTIWSFITDNDRLIAGGESQFLYFVDLRKKETEKLKCEMICSLAKHQNLLYLGTYTNKVLVYDLRKGFLDEIGFPGEIWKIKFRDEQVLIAAMHEGVYVCDNNFNVKVHFKEKSMVYDAEMFEDMLIYSSFYENGVYLRNI